MTRINLLPEEYRPVEETPAARRYTIFIGVAIVAALLAGVVYFRFILLPGARETQENLKRDRQNLNEPVALFDKLVTDIKRLEALRTIVEDQWRERVLWARKLDQLKAIVPRYIWITELNLEEPRKAGRRRISSRGKLIMKVISASKDMDNPTNFIRILTGRIAPLTGPRGEPGKDITPSVEFAADFDQLSHNKVSLDEFDDKYEERFGYKTKISLNVKALEQPKKPPVIRKKVPPKK